MPIKSLACSPNEAVQAPLFDELAPPLKPAKGVGIESRFDTAFVAALALREKQIQQHYRPVIGVHKWFARRPGTLFRALLLAEFAHPNIDESFFTPQTLSGVRVADPFMGGGTPLIEANRLGCDVLGFDINPMAYWIVRQEIEHLDVPAYTAEASRLAESLASEVGDLYRTTCMVCGRDDASAKYFLWVKTIACAECGEDVDLFPGYTLAKKGRHPTNVVVCAACGDLTETEALHQPGACRTCSEPIETIGPAKRGRCKCRACGHENTYPRPHDGPPRHKLFALEYYCGVCRPRHIGRFFKVPDEHDRVRHQQAVARLVEVDADLAAWIPDDQIPAGDETTRLHRWGYRRYRELFGDRQLLGLAHLSAQISAVRDERLRSAAATNLSDLLRYQNMLCRYDTSALKSLDIFSVHGFPVGLIQCESNLLGISDERSGGNVGSGGWSNIVGKFAKAKEYCDRPFEIRYRDGRKTVIPMHGEWIGDRRIGNHGEERRVVDLRCGSATVADVPPSSVDAVLTDPPYFANVQYAELIDFCYVWLRRLVVGTDGAFDAPSTRNPAELTGNVTLSRGLEDFTAGLAQVFQRMAMALAPGGPLAFTYHHNDVEAYYPVAVGLLDAGLVCTASLAAPAEMSGSIHIHNTRSSIVDTVFVCRTRGTIPRRLLQADAAAIAVFVADDLAQLAAGGLQPTLGDARCLSYGHIVRLAIWHLRDEWNRDAQWSLKLAALRRWVASLGGPESIETLFPPDITRAQVRTGGLREARSRYHSDEADAISF